MKKIFIYYSLSGNGDLVAKTLKEQKIDTYKIQTKEKMPKSFIGTILKGGFLASINHKAKLLDFNPDISSYDEIIIGSPIWNARLSTPINSVIEKLDLTNKKVSFIFYSGGGTSPRASKKVNELFKDIKIINLKEPIKNKEELKKLDNI